MFNLRDFVKNGFIKAVGSQPDFWIVLNATGYYDKGILAENDLADIQLAIDAKNVPPEMPESEV